MSFTTSDHPKVFISYSHDSREHKDRVLELSDRLCDDGIDCHLDQYEESPAEGWPRWMVNQIEDADFVLVVCTENYERRFRGMEDTGKGLGVKWEGAIITQEVYDAEAHNTTFIPVLFSPDHSAYIPIVLRGATRYEIKTDEGYIDLYRRLTGQHPTPKPELGPIRPMALLERKQLSGDLGVLKSPSTRENSFSKINMTTPQEGPARILKRSQEGDPGAAAIDANPYDFEADIKDRHLFAGRRSEIAEIREELARLTSTNPASPIVALVGERRVGKTSLLHRISELSVEFNILPCTIPMTNSLARSAGEFWYEVFQRLLSSANTAGVITDEDIREEIGYKPTQSEGEQRAGFRATSLGLLQWYTSRSQLGDPGVPPLSMVSTDLKSLTNAIAARYCGVLLMLDEAHLLAQSLDLIQQLRHAVRESSRCGIIFAGERGLNQMFTDSSAPFYLQARIIPVGNFVAKADIAECALWPLAENERPLMSPMTIDHLGRLSLGKPNQIRLICYSIYRRYLKKDQRDLNITIEALDYVLDRIQASYESEYDLKQRVDMIRRLPSLDLEVLYLITRYPEWHPRDVVALDEAFRGEKTSIRAMERRHRRLKQKSEAFMAMGLLQNHVDRYILAGDEFLQLYLRFFYEVRRYGNLKKRIQLGERPATPFGEKAEKLVRSLAWEVRRFPSVVNLTFFGGDAERSDLISDVRHRFTLIEAVLRGEPIEPVAESQAFLESLSLCQLIARHARYYLLVIVIRNLENPRESFLLEIYFETGEPLVFPLTLLREQAEAAKILVQEFDSWFVELPTLDEFVRGFSGGHTLDEIIARTGTFEQWMVRSIQKLVEEGIPIKEVTQDEREEDKEPGWRDLYRQKQYSAAVDAITTQIRDNLRGAMAARLYNDRGYIRYEMPNESENAKRDLERAVDLHHQALALTLLNLSIIAIDSQDYVQAIEKIEDALLITHGRENMGASYLRLRLLPGHLIFSKREKWEQHPANVLEAAYVNLAYASAQQSGYDVAREVLEESLELMPASVHLRHALARLHLWRRRADLAGGLYQELAAMPITDIGLMNEIQSYLKLRPRKRR